MYGAVCALPSSVHLPPGTRAAKVTVASGSPVTWAVTAARVATGSAPGAVRVMLGAAAACGMGRPALSTTAAIGGTVRLSLPSAPAVAVPAPP